MLNMWVFGYGSLIWKVDFPYSKKLVGYIKGYSRRFWQHSEDHRGVPGKPGRVVTLVHSTNYNDKVWGVAYEISKDDEEYVMTHLDFREKDGYDKEKVTFYPCDPNFSNCEGHVEKNKPFDLVIYVGNEDNKWYAGPADIKTIAEQIVYAEGPSGTNREYVYNLAAAMRKLGPGIIDDHLFEIERAVKACEEAFKGS